MNWFNKVKQLFSHQTVKPIEPISKQLNEIKQYDDVWIKINNKVYSGWIVERLGNVVSVVYTDSEGKLIDTTFSLFRPFDRDFLEENGKVLYLRPPANENS